LAESCKEPEPELFPIGEARVVGKTDEGNFIVTPAFIIWAKMMKDRAALLELELKKCQELKNKK
jgi:hypothetical protein